LNKKGKADNGGGNKFRAPGRAQERRHEGRHRELQLPPEGRLQASFANYDLDDTTVQDAAVTVPVSFTAGAGHYAADQPFSYDAKLGKSGTAKAP
jgi:hypothetical protein